MLVTLYRCDRCSLTFVSDDPPSECPSCRRHHTGETIIRLAGRKVPVYSARIYGDNPLKKAAAGLGDLPLGCRCPHGFIASYICIDCNPTA
jgi:hypothetical protein